MSKLGAVCFCCAQSRFCVICRELSVKRSIFRPWAGRFDRVVNSSLNGHLCFHITNVVFLESQPFIRGMSRKVAGTLSVGLGGHTGLTEIFDEFLSFSATF